MHNRVVSVPSSHVVNTDKESESARGTRVFLGGRYSREEVISFGGILESAVLGVRISERIKAQSNADATQLERAQQHAQARDDILYSGTKIPSQFTIAAIPNDVVAARASKLGISLGTSPSTVTESIRKIKDLDLHRTLILLQRKECEEIKDRDPTDSLVFDEATRLSTDLLVEENDFSGTHKEPPLRSNKPTRVHKRRAPDFSVARHCSARLKNNK
jgi:hypothetical protein